MSYPEPYIIGSRLKPSPMPQRKAELVSDWRVKHPEGTFRRSVEDLDELTSIIVRTLYGPLCLTCKKRRGTQNGHLFTRRIIAVRFDIHPTGNCQPSCSACNKRHQRNKDFYVMAFVDAFGSDAFALLRDRAFSDLKFSRLELEAKAKEYGLILGGLK